MELLRQSRRPGGPVLGDGNNRSIDTRRMVDAVVCIHGLMAAELFLRWSSEELPEEIERIIAAFLARGLLRRSEQGDGLLAPEANSEEFPELDLIGETLRPTLSRHFLVLALLEQRGSGALDRRKLFRCAGNRCGTIIAAVSGGNQLQVDQ